MPARSRKKYKNKINLLPQAELESSLSGRILRWAVTSFRYIVILTEVIVMGAFLSRFWLDTAISDLNDELEHAKGKITSFATFEREFREAQQKLTTISQIKNESAKPSQTIDSVRQVTPQEVALTSFSLTGRDVKLAGNAVNEIDVSQYLSNLDSSGYITNLELNQTGTINDELPIKFNITGTTME